MSEPGLVNITGRLRSPAATPGHWGGCAPPNKGRRYPADPPTVEEIILVILEAGQDRTRTGSVGSSRFCGAPACGSAKRRSASRRFISKESTHARSLTRFTTADRR